MCLLGGTDAVINSLTSPGMIAASLAALNHSGCFLEVGKRGIWSADRVAQVRMWRQLMSALTAWHNARANVTKHCRPPPRRSGPTS